jgi:CRISPR-associated protein Cas2
MRIILIYDVGEERVCKVMKICREYLEHIQNSVFEGDISDAHFKEMIVRIRKKIDEGADSVIVYHLWSNNYKKEIFGIEKRNLDNIL